MNYHAALKTALGPLVEGRYSPLVFPQPKQGGPTWPAIRGTRVGVTINGDICGDGDDDNDTPTYQIDIVTDRKLGYQVHYDLRAQVFAAMRAFPVPARVELELETIDEETDTFRSIVDYSLHGSN